MILQDLRLVTQFVFLIAWGAVLSSCVSVSLENKTVKRSADAQAQSPAAPFEKINAEQVDGAWKNSKTGNIISFLSDCTKNTDPSLESLHYETLQGLQDEKILSENRITYLERDALRSSITGKVDGIVSSLDLLIFKKNGCSYVLSFISTPKTRNEDLPYFEKFLNGFRVP